MKYVQKRNWKIGMIFLFPSMLVLFATTIFPMLYALWLSFRQYNLAKPFIPRVNVGLRNYETLLNDDGFYNSLWITFKLILFTVPVQLALGLALALLMTQQLRGARVLRTLLMIPMMISPVVAALVWLFLYFPGLGYLNYFTGFLGIPEIAWISDPDWALISIALVDIWQWTPFVMLAIAAGLQSLDPEPYEAARIDGNSAWQVLWHVTIPRLKTVILTLLFLRLIDTFKMYDTVFVLTKGGPGDSTETLSFYIYREGFTLWQMGLGAAASFISLMIIIIMTTFFLKTLTRSGAK